jgi:hypothetical protein
LSKFFSPFLCSAPPFTESFMRFLLTALLAFFAYSPVTAGMLQTDFFAQLQSLLALSPNAATLAGASVIWPAIFLCGCYGGVDIFWTSLTGGPHAVAKFVTAARSDVTGSSSSVIR